MTQEQQPTQASPETQPQNQASEPAPVVPAASPAPEAPAAEPSAAAAAAPPEPRAGRVARGRSGGPRAGGRGPRRDDRGGEEGGVESSVIRIYRCAKVVKGGRTFSFGALVVAGDRHGNVGIGYGKANEVPNAVEKATKDARKNMFHVNLKGTTIPHMVKGHAGASTVVLIPARPGTGVTAGKSVRPVVELAGITDVLTKAYGSTSPKNLVKATIDALRQLQSKEQVAQMRGVELPRGAGELVTA
ncbi:30S ribosomal protein S5 [Fontivita pretiosa]|uniref:30S ribosomal protein S5 n=1 Tax=Fontivita pretiosa TaxID=2989684 RepID=UPI003D17ABE0